MLKVQSSGIQSFSTKRQLPSYGVTIGYKTTCSYLSLLQTFRLYFNFRLEIDSGNTVLVVLDVGRAA